MALEDTFEGVGCIGPDAILVTDVGMFFCDYSGMYWHNGQKTENIGRDIYGDASGVNPHNWHDVDHKDANGNFISPQIVYDPKTQAVIFAFSNAGVSKAWVMSLTRRRWDLIDVPGNFGRVTGSRNDIYLTEGVSLWELFRDNDRNDYSWNSKSFDFGNSSIEKKLNKVKIVFNNNAEASTFLANNSDYSRFTMLVDGSSVSYKQKLKKNVLEIRFSGSTRRGYLFKFQLKDVSVEIDSISMIYTMGSIK
jgi:hypothetical protein